MSATHGRIEALITVPTGGWTASIQGGSDGSPVNATVAAGTYYMASLLTAFDTACDTASADGWTASQANGEDGTGKVTISSDGGTCTVSWTDTDLRDALGFATDGNLSGASTYTSTDQAKMCWFPDTPIVTEGGHADDGKPESDMRSTESPGGNGKTVAGSRKTVNSLAWKLLSHAKARVTGEVVGNESFEQFWIDAIMGEGPGGTPGAMWNLYWDADAATVTNYRPHGLGVFGSFCTASVPNLTAYWDITIGRVVKVPT